MSWKAKSEIILREERRVGNYILNNVPPMTINLSPLFDSVQDIPLNLQYVSVTSQQQMYSTLVIKSR